MAMYIMVLVMRVQEPCAVSDNKIGFLIHCIENIHYITLTVDMHTEITKYWKSFWPYAVSLWKKLEETTRTITNYELFKDTLMRNIIF